MTRVLIVDDEPQLRRALDINLRIRDYEVDLAATGEDALRQATKRRPDLVILDLGLPGIDGVDVLWGLRGWTDVPIIVLTVRDRESDKVVALDAGADDYITKPFSLEELTARVRARLRSRDDAGALKAGPLTVDPVSHRAVLNGREVPLSARELALLAAFIRHNGQVLSRSQLLDMVWDLNFDPGSNVVEVYVAALRRKIGAGWIDTVRGMGYRFSAPVETAAETTA